MRIHLICGAAVLLLPLAGSAGAEAPTHVFTGSCVLTGLVSSPTPVGWVPGQQRWDIEVQGHCSGRLDGEAVSALPTSLREVLRGEREGCLPAGTATAEGFLDFGRGRRLHFTGTQAVLPVLVMQGRAGGTASSLQTAYTFAGNGGTQSCTEGEYRSGGFEVRIRADQPLVG